MLGAVVGLLALHLAAGSLFVTALLALLHHVPPGFVRFCTLGSALVALSSAAIGGAEHPARWSLALISTVWYVFSYCVGARSLSCDGDPTPVAMGSRLPTRWAEGSARRTKLGRAALWAPVLSALTALAVLMSEAALFPDGRTSLAFGFLTSAFLLGSTTVSMILGHWYLVDPTLSIAPLRLGALLFALSVAARWIAVALVLLDKGSAVLGVERAADLVYSTPALFFLFRALAGLGGPLLLAGLIWQTVRMRSTQSATGLLYVAVILVLFGELISQFLTVTARVPL